MLLAWLYKRTGLPSILAMDISRALATILTTHNFTVDPSTHESLLEALAHSSPDNLGRLILTIPVSADVSKNLPRPKIARQNRRATHHIESVIQWFVIALLHLRGPAGPHAPRTPNPLELISFAAAFPLFQAGGTCRRSPSLYNVYHVISAIYILLAWLYKQVWSDVCLRIMDISRALATILTTHSFTVDSSTHESLLEALAQPSSDDLARLILGIPVPAGVCKALVHLYCQNKRQKSLDKIIEQLTTFNLATRPANS
ncbi:hypothetical protein B0H11DRAFT_2242311 [Mycena galericulata]|nr:hypothetical protein B0H11DRAFT_2242311 [Mycena galericulata]